MRSGQNVQLVGGESTLIVGKQQLRVQTGATLDVLRITIAESASASALVIAGGLSMKNCTVRNCVAEVNSLDGRGLQSRGGGMYVKTGGTAAVLDCRLVDNAARNGSVSSDGGAIFAGPKSSVKLVGTMLSLNVASNLDLPGYDARGGALFADKASVEAEDAELLGNSAKNFGGAICALGPGATLKVVRSKLAGNSAVNNAGAASGGALSLLLGVSLEMVSSELTENVARSLSAVKPMSSGGALFIQGEHRVNIAGCTAERNAAESAVDGGSAYGGAFCASCAGFTACELRIVDTTVLGNRAHARSWAHGGGFFMTEHRGLSAARSRINENTVEGGGPTSKGWAYGGGLYLAKSSMAKIVDTELTGNVAKNSEFSRGGAMFLTAASEATLERVVVRDNAAEAAGKISEGGAFFVEQSSLAISESDLLRNAALNGTKESRGGLAALVPPSNLRIVTCAVRENSARSSAPGARCSGGAIYAADGASQLSVATSRVLDNSVLSGPDATSAGGAVYAGKQSRLQLNDSDVDRNHASGGSAQGGAIWCSGESLTMFNVSLAANVARANARDAAAIGGAIFQQAAVAELVECRLVDNTARIDSLAIRASGGALHVVQGARASLLRCSLRHNAAGGQGKYQDIAANDADALAEQRASSAMHIYSEGRLTLDGCTMSDEIGQQAMRSFRYTMWWWIVAEKGAVELRGSTFDASARFDPCGTASDGYCNVPTTCPAGDYADCGTAPSAAPLGYFFDPCLSANDGKCDSFSGVQTGGAYSCKTGDYVDCRTTPPPDAGPFGKLLNVRSEQAEVVIRSCAVTNLTVRVVGALGVVNSTFVPQLNDSEPTTRTVQPDPDCGRKLLGQHLCDPRALCQPGASGGVECTCVGEGLDFSPGLPADGQRCQQQTRINLQTQTSRVAITVKKPSSSAGAVAVVFAAAGEIGFNVSYNMSMKRVLPNDGTSQLQGPNATARGWSAIDQQRMSMDGHHVIWQGTPPSADGAVDLSYDAGRFSSSKTFGLSIELNCKPGEPCVEDGDTVHTVVTAVAAFDGLVSAVMIITTVESLVSCEHSTVWVDPDVVPISTTIRVHFFANDVDKLPVSLTRAEINVGFGGRRIAVEWSRGSNEYVAQVPAVNVSVVC